jgi:hypothetical protein
MRAPLRCSPRIMFERCAVTLLSRSSSPDAVFLRSGLRSSQLGLVPISRHVERDILVLSSEPRNYPWMTGVMLHSDLFPEFGCHGELVVHGVTCAVMLVVGLLLIHAI